MLRRPPGPTLFPLHDALPIFVVSAISIAAGLGIVALVVAGRLNSDRYLLTCEAERSEEHTSELQSQFHLVCRLLLEKKKKNITHLHMQQSYTPESDPHPADYP